MSQKKVGIIVLSAFGLVFADLFLFSTVQELIRGRHDIEVLIGMIIVPCTVILNYLVIIKLYKFSKK